MNTLQQFNLKPLPKKSNLVNFSLLQEFYSANPFRSFSIKYVVDGCETYQVNGTKYQVQTNNYLLANHFSEGFVEINSKKTVIGICIDIEPKIISEVVASLQRPDTAFVDLNLDSFFNTPNFLENNYSCNKTHLGSFLQQLDFINHQEAYKKQGFSTEFYYTAAEKIITDHIPIFKQLQKITTIKPQTRKDLLRRITKSKEFIDTCFATITDINAIAKEIGMSEYHFFRTFKTVYAITPHQYLLQKRLEYAQYLLKKGNFSVSETATEAGFADIYSFSKAFKKHFGNAPSY